MMIPSLAFSVLLIVLGASQETMLKSALWATITAGILMIPTAIYLIHKDEQRRNPLKKIQSSLRAVDVIWMLGLGASLAQLLNMLLSVLKIFEMFPSYQQQTSQVILPHSFPVILLCVGIIGPIAEEYVFRGVIYPRLKDYLGVWWAVLLSALLFGAFHGNLVQFIYATLMGVALAWSAEYFHTLKASILLHISANIWVTVLGDYGNQWVQSAGDLLVVAIVLLPFLIVILSAIYLACGGKNRR